MWLHIFFSLFPRRRKRSCRKVPCQGRMWIPDFFLPLHSRGLFCSFAILDLQDEDLLVIICKNCLSWVCCLEVGTPFRESWGWPDLQAFPAALAVYVCVTVCICGDELSPVGQLACETLNQIYFVWMRECEIGSVAICFEQVWSTCNPHLPISFRGGQLSNPRPETNANWPCREFQFGKWIIMQKVKLRKRSAEFLRGEKKTNQQTKTLKKTPDFWKEEFSVAFWHQSITRSRMDYLLSLLRQPRKWDLY